MRTTYSPIRHSGWIYLWFCLILVVFWGWNASLFDDIEIANQNLWKRQKISTPDNPKLLRIVDIAFDRQGFEKLRILHQKFPQVSFAIVGQYSEGFLQLLSLPENRSIAQRVVLLSSQNWISASLLADKTNLATHIVNRLFFSSVISLSSVVWKTFLSQKFLPQPWSHGNRSHIIFESEGNIYPTFIAQVLIQNKTAIDGDLSTTENYLSSDQQLVIGPTSYPLSSDGSIITVNQIPMQLTYAQLFRDKADLNSLVDSSKNGTVEYNNLQVLILDDLSIRHTDVIASTISSLLDKQYWTSNQLTIISQYFLLGLLILSVFWTSRLSSKVKLIVAIAGTITLILVQSFFIGFSQWFSITPLFICYLVTWLIQIAHSKENKYFVDRNERGNSLLAEATPLFYHSQKFDSLFPHLEASSPNLYLIDKVYETAIEAEAHKNTMLAKKLHTWILENNSKYTPSMERMTQLCPKASEQADLESTLVIDENGNTSMPRATSLLKIEKLGRYKVEGILGKGAMGVVFQGVDPKINRYVAIKTLQLTDELDDESLLESKDRFFREAETAGNLSHANIVTIYDVGEELQPNSGRSLGYIAMDLLTGAPLSEYVKKGKLLPPTLVYQLIIQMTDALDYAHKQKVIHRDIKPANIIYDDELQRGTLTDFGIAYISDHSKTKTGTIMGSPYYMSPEQVLGIKVDGRSDIFSLGVTFYQLLSGHLPFTGESIASVAFHITKTKHDSVREWNKKLPSSAARITNKAMQKETKKRYQTMQEFKQALINALKRDYNKSPLS